MRRRSTPRFSARASVQWNRGNTAWRGFLGDFDAKGSVGALICGPGRSPGKSGTMVYLIVPDVDRALETVRQRGGSVVMPTTRGEFGAMPQVG